MEINLLDRMLNTYMTERTPVTLTLQNKIRVTGKVKAFDSYVVVMEGQKREILYRHAISSLAPSGREEEARPPVATRPAPAKTAPRPQKAPSLKSPAAHHHAPPAASASEASINTAMKEGLLRWMQEQKAAK